MPTPVDVATSKVQILESPRQLPGTCMLCGTSRTDDRQYIDIGKDIQFVGVVYFCTFCMTEIANRLGCLMPEQTKALEDELDAARQRILEFQTKDETLNAAIDTLRDTGLFSGTDLTAVRRDRSVSNQQDKLELDRNPEGNQLSIAQTDNDATESATEQRSDDVSTTRSDELKFDFDF